MAASVTHKEKLVGIPNNPAKLISADAFRDEHDVSGLIESIGIGPAGTVTIDLADPKNPVIDVPNIGVTSVTAEAGGITVDNTDPTTPVLSFNGKLPVYASHELATPASGFRIYEMTDGVTTGAYIQSSTGGLTTLSEAIL